MNSNDLLLWLSTTGQGTWSRYRAALDELTVADLPGEALEDAGEEIPDPGTLPQHLRFKLNLERLGHAEFFRHDFKNGWRVAPPSLVAIPDSGGACGVLCGARTDQLLTQLTQILGEDRVHIKSQVECPDRILLQTSSIQDLFEVAKRTNLIFQVGGIERLLTTIPPIDNYQLRIPSELPFGEDWEVERFSTVSLKWMQSSIHEARKWVFGLFRIRVRFRPEYFIKLKGNPYRLPVQVGKYIALRRARRKVLRYDFRNRGLAIPTVCRPPLLLDRALTLCTGLIPEVVAGCLEYHGIEPRHWSAAKRILRQ